MQYRLERVDRVPKRPGWAGLGGMVVHEIINAYERARARADSLITPDGAAELFRVGLRIKVEETRETTTFAPELWYAADGGRENREWWEDNAPGWIASYIEAQADRTAETLVAGDRLMLEADLSAVISGVPVRGIIDHVLLHANGDITVRDFKFGRSAPPDGQLQLPTYAVMLAANGLLPEPTDGSKQVTVWGDYWLGRKGAASRATRIDLAAAYERLAYEASTMDMAERAGLYPVQPSNLCVACSVRYACPVRGDEGQRRSWVPRELPNSSLLTGGAASASVLVMQQRAPLPELEQAS